MMPLKVALHKRIPSEMDIIGIPTAVGILLISSTAQTLALPRCWISGKGLLKEEPLGLSGGGGANMPLVGEISTESDIDKRLLIVR